jgi:2-iminobutanoate/2-iminopropanoate deaminase
MTDFGEGKRAVSTPKAPQPGGVYSQAVWWNNLLFTAGVTPADPATRRIVGDTIEEQTRRTLDNLGAILEAAGLTFDDVLKVTVHLADIERDFAGFNQVYGTYFREPYPVRTTVGSRLPGFLIEVDLVAGRRP